MIFFDIDGTLVDHKGAERSAALVFQNDHAGIFPESPDAFVARWQAVAEKHVRRYLANELSFKGQRRSRERELFAHHSVLTDAEADALFARYLKRYEENCSLYPDVKPCIQELTGYKLGIISNGDSRQQRGKLQMLGIFKHFSTVLISGDIGIAKPAPDIFHAACQEAMERPDECVYVGDDFDEDAVGSRRAGMKGIWLNRDDSSHPDEVGMIRTLNELRKHIESHNNRVQATR